MQIPTAIWTRKEWQKRRDTAKVATGASKKVSVGDELDKFHKANKAGVSEGLKQSQVLAKKLEQYCADIKKSEPKFEAEVRRLLAEVKGYPEVLKDISKAVKKSSDMKKAAKAKYASLRDSAVATFKADGEAKFLNDDLLALKEIFMQVYYAANALRPYDPELLKKDGRYMIAAEKIKKKEGIDLATFKSITLLVMKD